MKYILPLLLLAAMGLTGCASVIGIVSEEGLKKMQPDRRADYRSILDDVALAIQTAQEEYDARYDKEGEPLVSNPMPEPEPAE